MSADNIVNISSDDDDDYDDDDVSILAGITMMDVEFYHSTINGATSEDMTDSEAAVSTRNEPTLATTVTVASTSATNPPALTNNIPPHPMSNITRQQSIAGGAINAVSMEHTTTSETSSATANTSAQSSTADTTRIYTIPAQSTTYPPNLAAQGGAQSTANTYPPNLAATGGAQSTVTTYPPNLAATGGTQSTVTTYPPNLAATGGTQSTANTTYPPTLAAQGGAQSTANTTFPPNLGAQGGAQSTVTTYPPNLAAQGGAQSTVTTYPPNLAAQGGAQSTVTTYPPNLAAQGGAQSTVTTYPPNLAAQGGAHSAVITYPLNLAAQGGAQSTVTTYPPNLTAQGGAQSTVTTYPPNLTAQGGAQSTVTTYPPNLTAQGGAQSTVTTYPPNLTAQGGAQSTVTTYPPNLTAQGGAQSTVTTYPPNLTAQGGAQSTVTTYPPNLAAQGGAHSAVITYPLNLAATGGTQSTVTTYPPNLAAQGGAQSTANTTYPPNLATQGGAHSLSTLVQSGVTLVHVSPMRKTKEDLDRSLNDFRDREKTSRSSKQSESDDENEFCPICFEPWSNSGAHRLASLNCGHLFGRSCIERWLRQERQNKCPQCNSPARRNQIRNIYAKRLHCLDTSERDHAVAELEKERQARKKAEEANANALLATRVLEQRCAKMHKELELQKKLMNSQRLIAQPSVSAQGCCRYLQFFSSRYVASTGARVLAINNNGLMVVSRPSQNNGLFGGFGVLKLSTLDDKHAEYIPIHEKAIRDVVFSDQDNTMMLTASLDKTLKITSIRSNACVISFKIAAPVWCCAWDDQHCVFAGSQNGLCYVFDTRYVTHIPLAVLKRLGTGPSYPLVSLAHVSRDHVDMPRGILSCSLKDLCFWTPAAEMSEYQSNDAYVPLNVDVPEGLYTSLRYETTSRHLLISQRPSEKCGRVRHIVMRQSGALEDQTGGATHESLTLPTEAVTTCYGGNVQSFLSRSALFVSPGDGHLVVGAGDDATNSVVLWDVSSTRKIQSIPQKQGKIIDVCSFNENNFSYLATLSDQHLQFYRWQ